MADLAGVWKYDTSEVIAAPAPGFLRTGPAPVSRVAISTRNQGGADASADLLGLDPGGQMLVQQVNDAMLASKFQLTADPLDHTTWVEFAVAPLATTATGPPTKNTDLLVTGYAAVRHPPYATLDEFVTQRLRLDSPTPEQLETAQRALDAAAEEIDSYLGYTAETPAPDPLPALVVTVNLDRAGEHWRNLPYGVLSSGPESVPVLTARNSWYRHAQKLLPLKDAWGVG